MFHLVFFEKIEKLLLEAITVVVVFLICNVLGSGPNHRLTDGKSSIAALPIEVMQLRKSIFDPIGGGTLDFFDQCRDRKRFGKTAEDVDMILDPTDPLND